MASAFTLYANYYANSSNKGRVDILVHYKQTTSKIRPINFKKENIVTSIRRKTQTVSPDRRLTKEE